MDVSELAHTFSTLIATNLPVAIAVIALVIIGLMAYGLARMSKSKKGSISMAASVNAVATKVDEVCKDITAYTTLTKEDHDRLIAKMDDDSRELREAISTLKDAMNELQTDMIRTRERITDAGANTSSSIKTMIGQMQRLVDKVVDISTTLKTIVADVFRDRVGQRIDQKDNNPR